MKRKRIARRYGRRTRRKRTIVRKRRTMRRRPGRVINVKRTLALDAWSFADTSTSGFYRYNSFNMGNGFNNFGEFQNVFDEFRVNACKWTYVPRFTTVAPTDISPTVLSNEFQFHYCIDPATTTAATGTYSRGTLNSFLQQGNTKTLRGTRTVTIYYKPMVEGQLFGTGTAAYVRKCPWLKTSETGIDLRGHYAFINQSNFAAPSAVNMVYDVYLTVYAQFRNMK